MNPFKRKWDCLGIAQSFKTDCWSKKESKFIQITKKNKKYTEKKFDILYLTVELASQLQTADQFTRATAGSKLAIIAEQVKNDKKK